MSVNAPFAPLIVVPCLNEALHIGPVLRQILRARDRLGGRIVVVDGGSTDGTCEIVRGEFEGRYDAHLIHNPARIQSAGINLAVAEFGALSTHLIRIDAHCAYPETYFDVLLEEARSTGAASVVVSMEAHGATRLQRAIAAAQNAPVGNGGAKHRNPARGEYVDHGHHALISLAAFREVGGYDPSFSHNEDAEFDHRLKRAGYNIWLTSRTHVTYYPRSTYPALARQYFNYGTGRARNMVKHRTLPNRRQFKVMAILPLVALAGFSGLSPVLALPVALWFCYCCVMALVLATQQKDAAMLIAAPMAMVMHLSWSAGFWAAITRAPGLGGVASA